MTITKSQIVTWSLLAIVAIIGIILLIRIFKGSSTDSQYLETIKAQQETIKAIQGERDALNLVDAEKDKSIAAHNKVDSLLLQTLNNNQQKYKANDKKGTDITKHVNDLDHESLLREISDY